VSAWLEGTPHRVIEVSALRGEGLAGLRAALGEMMGGGRLEAAGAAVSHPRHVAALERANNAIARAVRAGGAGEPGEIVALELREALEALGEITGRQVSDDLLERIFSRFCVGK
jgi:tRNA modification GTPase